MKISAVEKGITYLRSQITSGVWPIGTRLPTCKQLAVQAGIGYNNMQKAIGILKKEKLLIFKERTGIYAGHTIPLKAQSVEKKLLKWEHIKNQIKYDIFNNRFSDMDFLPSAKELLGLYSIDMRTLHKAIDGLTKEVLIVRERGKYLIRIFKAPPLTHVIYLILSDAYVEGHFFSTDQIAVNEFVQSAEKACSTKNIRLVQRKYSEHNASEIDTSTLLGTIVWHTPDLNTKTIALVHSLKLLKKPVAVYLYTQPNKDDLTSLFDYYREHTTFFLSNITYEKRAGSSMGEFILSKGHKKICFIGWDLRTFDASERYTGLCEAFTHFNAENGIVPIIREDMIKKGPHLFAGPPQKSALTKDLDFLDATRTAATTVLSAPYAARLSYHIQDIRFARDCLTFYRPLFQKALNEYADHVWVCVDDHSALNGVLEFIKEKKINQKEIAGLAAFGDVTESRMHNLTSYHLDIAGAAQKMVNLIMFPEYAKKALCLKGTTIFDVGGMVIDRGSV